MPAKHRIGVWQIRGAWKLFTEIFEVRLRYPARGEKLIEIRCRKSGIEMRFAWSIREPIIIFAPPHTPLSDLVGGFVKARHCRHVWSGEGGKMLVNALKT